MTNHLSPVFSVITITWNAESVLEETILSAINQTYSKVEYIIIDGGSDDSTLEIISRYADGIHYIISEPDKGLYDAMNKGMNLASGDYLCFLNAGDTFHRIDTLQCVVNSLNHTYTLNNNEWILPDIIYGETAIVNQQREFLHMRRLSAPEKLNWKSFKMGMLVCHQAFWVKREIAEPYDLTYRFSSDFDWCIRMLKKSYIIYNTHLVLIDYLSEGITTKNHKASLKERFRIMGKYYGWISTVFHHLWFVIRLLIEPEKNK